jgi:catechol 2,3-dioxygenase-like lactoylglutathione lyase family enzyme
MTVSLSVVHILVDDVDAALAFYRDTLGMTVQQEVANDGFRWITLSSDSQPEVRIVLSEPHAGRSKEDGDALAAMLAKGELYPAHFRCDALDATFDRHGPRRRGSAGAHQPALGDPRRRGARSRGQPASDRAGIEHAPSSALGSPGAVSERGDKHPPRSRRVTDDFSRRRGSLPP